MINMEDLCTPNVSPSSSSSSLSPSYQYYLLALTNLHPTEDRGFLSSNETESILQLINQHYQPPAPENSGSSHSQITSSSPSTAPANSISWIWRSCCTCLVWEAEGEVPWQGEAEHHRPLPYKVWP
ncbi:hypothetical protein J4Q44_G00363370 [Coregonus suidteri]|uniref:Zinc transporter ZIP4 N-terminal domain-containing protein n=1 Tax=Coregonus suidteri TaxID=861788 RepID=A0AAN8QAS9_9TELE